MPTPAIPLLLLGALLAFAHPAVAGEGDATQAQARKSAKKIRAGAEKAYGRPGDPRKVKRTISIEMSDAMRFFPENVRVKRGDTIRFRLRNGGAQAHAMVLGTMDELKKEAALLKHNPQTDHDGAHAVHVQPGSSATLVWQFTKPGEFHYACLMPGHFDAGMIGTIVVR